MSESDVEVVDSEREHVVISGEPGLIDGLVSYWESRAPRSIRDGIRDFSVDAEAHASYDHDPDADDESIDDAMRSLAWYIFAHDVRDEQRRTAERRNYERSGRAPSTTTGEERPDPSK